MAVNPYTLTSLYEHGIIDYVPQELCVSPNVSSLNSSANSYLNSAMQGALYQNHGMAQDSFSRSSQTFQGAGIYGNNEIGAQAVTGNMYGDNFIGSQSSAGMNAFGIGGIGGQSQISPEGLNGVGIHNPSGIMDAEGGFADAKRSVGNAVNTFNGLPSFVKGIIAGGILIGGTILMFKRGKKPSKKQAQQVSQNWWQKIKSKIHKNK